MSQYILRLDDASEYMDLQKWTRMEKLLDKYEIKPIFGIIPQNRDESLVSKYKLNVDFWKLVHRWIEKDWTPAMHGYEHRYVTDSGGTNPVNRRSEFAGLSYDQQAEKIRKGYEILLEHCIRPDIFFAPSHTFDEITLEALLEETPIRIISDTVAWDIYKKGDFWFIPQQSGSVRRLPFKTLTFCYHPNSMSENDYKNLEAFLKSERSSFLVPKRIKKTDRHLSIGDKILQKIYLEMHKR